MAKKEKSSTLILKEVLKLLKRPSGWVQGHYKQPISGKKYQAYCLLGALSAAENPKDIFGPKKPGRATAEKFIRKALTEQGHKSDIIGFNDSKKRQKKEVLAKVEHAIALSEK